MPKRNLSLLVIFCLIGSIVFVGCSDKIVSNDITKPSPGPDHVSDESQSTIPLTFKPVEEDEKKLEMLDNDGVGEIVKEVKLDNATVFIFKKPSDDFVLYGGVKVNGTLYEIDIVGYGDFDIQVKNTFLFNKPLIYIQGIHGATCPVTYYIYFKDNTPYILLYLERFVVEMDLDGDGEEEAIAKTGGLTEIYKLDKNMLIYSSLNKILNADYVFYPNEGSEEKDLTFCAFTPSTYERRIYKLTKEGFKMESVSFLKENIQDEIN
ncbi:MAG: hypothetical protein ACOYWZ_21680 [Bacillota bacterium]